MSEQPAPEVEPEVDPDVDYDPELDDPEDDTTGYEGPDEEEQPLETGEVDESGTA